MYKLNNEEWVSKGEETNYTIKVETGTYKVTTKAVDQAGNERIATNKEEEITIRNLDEYENEIEIKITPEDPEYAKQKTVEVIWPSELENKAGITKQISTNGGISYTPYTKSITIEENCTIYAQMVYSEQTITAVLTVETIDNQGPEIQATFNKEEMKLTTKVKDEKAGLKSIKIEKITSQTSSSEKQYTQVGETHQYSQEKQEQTIEETIKAAYQQYLRGYKITAIDEFENESIKEVTDLNLQNNQAIIYTAQELKEFQESVNAGNNYEGVTIQLGADIDLSELKDSTGAQESWIPIGNGSSTKTRFTGTFNGNGHTISNMKITKVPADANSSPYIGLFGYVGEKGTITNLILKDYTISASNSDACIGSMVGNNKGTISNISATGNINCNEAGKIGGLAGISANGVIKKVYTGGAIVSKKCYYVGGVSGVSGEIMDCYSTMQLKSTLNQGCVAGISCNGGSIERSYSLVALTGSDVLAPLGGVWSGSNPTVENSYWSKQVITNSTSTRRDKCNSRTINKERDIYRMGF